MACSNAHAMPRRHCTSPEFNLARTTLRWSASGAGLPDMLFLPE
jgi:hypothetical protein